MSAELARHLAVHMWPHGVIVFLIVVLLLSDGLWLAALIMTVMAPAAVALGVWVALKVDSHSRS